MQPRRQGGQESGPLVDRQVADGSAQEGDQAAVGLGEGGVEMHPKVADHARDLEIRVGRSQPGHGRPQGRLGHVEGDKPPQSANLPEGVDQGHRLVGGARSQLDQGGGPAASGYLRAVGGEHLTLGPGRVVLGQPGDLLEQGGALLVVQPPRRQSLGARHQTSPNVGGQRGLPFGAVLVDGDRRC